MSDTSQTPRQIAVRKARQARQARREAVAAGVAAAVERHRASGVVWRQWARQNGLPWGAVKDVVSGRRRCTRGDGYRVAVALGAIGRSPAVEIPASNGAASSAVQLALPFSEKFTRPPGESAAVAAERAARADWQRLSAHYSRLDSPGRQAYIRALAAEVSVPGLQLLVLDALEGGR